jgi:hypothetical protein
MANTIYQGDVGLEILVDCGRDISRADAAALSVRTPSGAVHTWPATVTDGNALRYVTRPGDLAAPGLYRLQATLSTGDWTGRGKTATFFVTPNFS